MKPDANPPLVPPAWEARPLEWPRATGQLDQLMAALAVRKKRRRRRVLAATVAAGTAVCLWLFTIARTTDRTPPPATENHLSVVTPEHRTLTDGTVIELKSDADVIVRFTAESAGPRLVELTRGTAHFQVAKNAARPFIVTAGRVQFRAVGTAFAVNLDRASVEMVVTEGRVAVEAVAAEGSAPVATADAGNRVVVNSAAPSVPTVSKLSATETRESLAWRVPRLEFNETPLRDVARLLALHSGRPITMGDDRVGRVEISGALRADNPDPLLQVLATTYGIVAERRPGGEIVLRSGR